MAAPKRDLFKAAEVCEVAQLQPYVLRSWEAEFPRIGQTPAGGGARVYRRADLELVLRIKQLVFEEGLTLSGARRRLEEDEEGGGAPAVLVEEVLGAGVRDKLKHVRTGLESILQLLAKDPEPELRLVPPPDIVPAAKKKTVAKGKAKK